LLTGPIGIFFINITGCFVIGLVAGFMPKLAFKSFFLIGFLGSYTTFSSYSLDVFNLYQKEKYLQALMYFCLSPLIGVLATFIGFKLATIISR
jgi:CrcB protein